MSQTANRAVIPQIAYDAAGYVMRRCGSGQRRAVGYRERGNPTAPLMVMSHCRLDARSRGARAVLYEFSLCARCGQRLRQPEHALCPACQLQAALAAQWQQVNETVGEVAALWGRYLRLRQYSRHWPRNNEYRACCRLILRQLRVRLRPAPAPRPNPREPDPFMREDRVLRLAGYSALWAAFNEMRGYVHWH